jgi:hypothetical protein
VPVAKYGLIIKEIAIFSIPREGSIRVKLQNETEIANRDSQNANSRRAWHGSARSGLRGHCPHQHDLKCGKVALLPIRPLFADPPQCMAAPGR